MQWKTPKVQQQEILPESFDARAKWGKECPSISLVPDQGNCGSCWAVSSAAVISDRICIHTSQKVMISAIQVTLNSMAEIIIQSLLGLATLGLATILGLATRNSGFLDDQYINSTLGLATNYIGFSDLNRVDKNWSPNPSGTVLAPWFSTNCSPWLSVCQ